MNFKEIIDLTKNRIDETDDDPQIDMIVKNAINHSYMFDMVKRDPRVVVAYVPVINGTATLPDDINKVISITPELEYNERRIGNVIITNRTVTFTVIYSTVPEPLVNDTDIPDISTKYHYSMSTYACYEYFASKKKAPLAQMFQSTYMNELESLDSDDSTGIETVHDVVGDK